MIRIAATGSGADSTRSAADAFRALGRWEGEITAAQVREVLEPARLHGFGLASYKRNQPAWQGTILSARWKAYS